MAPLHPQVRQLDCGLRVAVQTLPDSPVTSVNLWFDVGAADEGADNAGVAHFVEHMVFKGTARRGVGDAAGEVEGLGGDLNAWTSWDETCIHATVAAGGGDDALDVVFDMARASQFDPAELERERLVILEEIRGYADDPVTVTVDRLHEIVFGRHPYGRPVIGSVASVRGLRRDDITAFWRQNYHPGRALLSVAGPLDIEHVATLAANLAKGWRTGRRRRALAMPRPARRGRVECLDRDFGSVVVELGWPGPHAGHADVAPLSVLMHALGGGAASRLLTLLELDAGVASQVYADCSTLRLGGLISVGFLCGETEEAVRLVVRELTRVARSGISGPELIRARDGLLADMMFASETTEAVAADLAWAVARLGGAQGRAAHRAAIAAVGPADVRRVAATWLDPASMRMVVIDQELGSRALRGTVGAARRRPRAAPARGLQHHQVGALRVAVLADDSKVAAVKVLGSGGQLLETTRTAGTSEAWARTVLRGAGPWDAVAFAERSDALAVWLDAHAGRSTMGLQATFPAANTVEALDLLTAAVVDPMLDAHDVEVVRDEMLDDIAAQIDRPGVVATEALRRALWRDHPWRLPDLGTPAALQRLTPARIRGVHLRTMAADNIVVAVVGGVDPDEVLRAMEPLARAIEDPSRVALPGPPGPPGTTHRRRSAGHEQATVLLGVRGVALDDPDRTALSVACHILDSQSGRLFLRLREERGLAYGVWAQHATGVGGGTFQVGASTEPGRADEAARALRRELRLLAQDGPTEQELERTCRMVAGLSAMRHQRVLARASDLAWAVKFGVGYGLDGVQERLAALTPASIRSALQRIDVQRAVRVTVLPQ